MIRLIIVAATFALFLSTPVNAQLYSYSFSGTVKDSASLVSSVQQIEWIQKCKLLLKPEKPGGVVIFRLEPYEVTRDEKGNLINPQPLVRIKEYLLGEGLELKELIRLKD